MSIEDSKSNDYGLSTNASGKGENDILSKKIKNPNKTKYLDADDLSEKNRKKEVLSPINVKETCRAILEIIKKDPKSDLFRQPAIKFFLDQKDKEYYKKIIKEPRDLSYIAKKLKITNYTAKDFYDDLELCWSNAFLFNDINTKAYQCAIYLKDLSKKLYKEYNFPDIINREKEANSNKNSSSNTNTNDSVNSTNKTQNKLNNKKNNNNKENNKKNKGNDKSEVTETISSYSNYSSQSIENKKKNNSDSSYSSELKNNSKLTGKKRKRQKIHENEIKEYKNDKKNGSVSEIEKKSKTVKQKKTKTTNKESNQESVHTSHNKSTLADIKNKYPINHQIITNLDDIEKIAQKDKSNLINSKKGKNINKTKINNNQNINELHNKKNRKNTKISSNTNNNNININLLSNEDKKKVFYEIMWEIFNGKNPFNPNESEDNHSNNNENDLFLYNPMKYKFENKEIENYDKNCNTENVYNVVSLNPSRMQTSEDSCSNNKVQNNNTDIKIVNNNSKDKKDDKYMQLRIEIGKYFCNMSDDSMIELLVYIENIKPQSLRILENDTIYLDMETFNDETFIKIYEFAKKHI